MNKTLVERRNIKTAAAPSAPIFSQAVSVDRVIYVSGTVGADRNMKIPPTLQEQVHLLLENMKRVLEAGGSCMKNVVKLTTFLTNISDWDVVEEEIAKWFKAPYPAGTVMVVRELPIKLLVEIEAVAVVGPVETIY